ncbi:MAG: hypothetical protein LKI25_00415 [Atopobiaceae bacterium]|jgi:hypothetical protein|nr:hypothetical protein [Atopobiaceae bacterium]MCI2172675.1 hypothetical protein [Atopobiaceae bacterium]MCI2206982.1 hypothetical protein [Atopobiaceae bacterium]
MASEDKARGASKDEATETEDGEVRVTSDDDQIEDSRVDLDGVQLTIPEDRRRLALYAALDVFAVIGLLILMWLGLAFGSQGIIWAYLVSLLALAACWFTFRPCFKFVGKLMRHVGVCDFCADELVVHVTSKKDDVIPYGRIRDAQIVREPKAIRLLLTGEWVTHPAGVYYVGIAYPFQPELLDGLEAELRDVLKANHVKLRKQA